MRRLPKLRKVCKWTGLVLSVLLLVVWVGSGWWAARCLMHGKTLHVSNGVFMMTWLELLPGMSPQRTVPRKAVSLMFDRILPGGIGKFRWKFAYRRDLNFPADLLTLEIPIWPVSLGAFFMTLFLWHRDRRLSKPGLCKECGYDIRGLEVCPECGMAVQV